MSAPDHKLAETPTQNARPERSGADSQGPYSSDSRWATADLELEPGQAVGEYVVEGSLGRGAFGSVYRAVHPVIGKLVAIKVLNIKYSADPEIASRFVSEARAVNRIGHEGIVGIFAFGELEDGRQYYVMDALDGVTLSDRLRQSAPLELAEALDVLDGIGEGLDAAHAAGIAHRDLKPGNIFLVHAKGGGWRPKLLDFGVAKLMDEEEPRDHRTETGAAVGTPAYMAPEQCRGRGVDHRADIYAFGVVAFQVLTGRLPFESDVTFAVMNAHVNEAPPDPRRFAPHLPEPLAAAILWMLEKAPEDRPQTLAEATACLRATANGAPFDRTLSVGVLRDPQATDVSGVARPDPASAPPGHATLPQRPASRGFDTLAGDGTAPKSRAPLVAGLALLAVAGAAVAVLATRDPTSSSAPAPVEPTPALAPNDREPAPAVSPPDAPAPAPDRPAVPETVEVTVRGVPQGARVEGPDGALLRTGPGTFTLPFSQAAVNLQISAPGFSSTAQSVVPNAKQVLQVSLQRTRRPPPAPKSKPKPRPRRLDEKDEIPEW